MWEGVWTDEQRQFCASTQRTFTSRYKVAKNTTGARALRTRFAENEKANGSTSASSDTLELLTKAGFNKAELRAAGWPVSEVDLAVERAMRGK